MNKTTEINQRRQRTQVLQELFPKGIDKAKIWRNFVSLLGGRDHEQVFVDRLEAVLEHKFKLKRRISRRFPKPEDKLRLIFLGDIDLLHRITQRIGVFSESRATYVRDAIVLHGLTPDEVLLDGAAQAVITMLLRYIRVSIPV